MSNVLGSKPIEDCSLEDLGFSKKDFLTTLGSDSLKKEENDVIKRQRYEMKKLFLKIADKDLSDSAKEMCCDYIDSIINVIILQTKVDELI